MFTGIVEQIGTIVARERRSVAARLVVSCTFPDLVLGESIAVSGVCLTVDGIRSEGRSFAFEADASPETLARSTLADARVGRPVNLERALRADSRLGGHFVGGHVDARIRLVSRRSLGEATELRFSLPRALGKFVAPKGSVALDGVSLTVNSVYDTNGQTVGEGAFDVMVIPHTLRATTMVDLPVGAEINLEVDVLARYVARRLEAPSDASSGSPGSPGSPGSDDESLLRALREGGYT